MNRSIALWRPLLVVLLVFLILAVAGFFVTTLNVLLLAAAGVLLGVSLNALARGLPLSYGWAYALVVLLLIAGAVGGTYWLGSAVSQQINQLSNELRSSAQSFRDQLSQYEWMPQLPSQSQIRNELSQASGLLPKAVAGAQSAVWFLTAVLVILFIGLYVAAEPGTYREGILKLVPPARRSRATEVLERLRKTLVRWLLGRLFSMTVIGITTAIVLWFLDVPMAITLGVLAAILTFIPNIGPILAAVPQVLLALNVDGRTALSVLIFNLVLQTVESYLLTPLIQRYQVSLPPALTITAQLLLGVVVGPSGIMMAAPLIVVVIVLTEMLYVEEQPLDGAVPQQAG